MANPDGFDYWRAGEPLPALKGAVAATTGFDYWRQGEPFPGLVAAAATITCLVPRGHWGA